MHIIKLEAENIKRLQAVTIEPNGNMIVIGGANGAGKSSVLDCIEMALGGKKHICDVPLRRDTQKGYIVVETDKYIVKRVFTEHGTTLEVTSPEGYLVKSPQELLNSLFGDLSFDPLAFTKLDPKPQAAMLMRLLGLNFDALDGEYGAVELKRRDIGRDGESVKARLAVMPEVTAPAEMVVVADLLRQIEEGRKTNEMNLRIKASVASWERSVEEQAALIVSLQEQLKAAIEELGSLKNGLAEEKKRAEACVDVDVEPLVQQAQEAETTNARFRAAEQRKELAEQYQGLSAQYKALTERLREIEAEKSAAIAAAEFPVPGVSFSSDGVLVNGIPFDQASSAEQLKIAVAMGLSANPELKIALIRDGSLLDEASLAAVAEMAAKYDAQVLLERVGDGAEVSVVISDGLVSENRMGSGEVQDA